MAFRVTVSPFDVYGFTTTKKFMHGLESNFDMEQDQESAERDRWLLTSEKSAHNFEQRSVVENC